MADERLLNAIRRFWDEARVKSVYETILDAYVQRLARVTVVVGKSAADSSASAQVVVTAADYKEWMDVLESRLQELENEAAGTSGPPSGVTSYDHSGRYAEP